MIIGKVIVRFYHFEQQEHQVQLDNQIAKERKRKRNKHINRHSLLTLQIWKFQTTRIPYRKI